MARKRSRHAPILIQPQPSIEPAVEAKEPEPSPPEVSSSDMTGFGVIASFEDMPDEVPSLDDLPQTPPEEYAAWEHDRQPEQRVEAPPTDEDLAAESTPERQELVDQFDPAPIDPSPPSWDAEESQAAMEALPTTVVDENLLALAREVEQVRYEFEQAKTELSALHAEVGGLNEQLLHATVCIETRDAQLATLQMQHDALQVQFDAVSAEYGQRGSIIERLDRQLKDETNRNVQVEAERNAFESRLVDSELTRADIEAQLDALRVEVTEMRQRSHNKKLWQIFTRQFAGTGNQPAQRIFVVASTIDEALARAAEANIAKSKDITNVVEVKLDQLVV